MTSRAVLLLRLLAFDCAIACQAPAPQPGAEGPKAAEISREAAADAVLLTDSQPQAGPGGASTPDATAPGGDTAPEDAADTCQVPDGTCGPLLADGAKNPCHHNMCSATGGCCYESPTSCYAVSDAACKATSLCSQFGECSLDCRWCSALTDADCEPSDFCKSRGLCKAVDGVCKVSAAGCKASTFCKDLGWCTADPTQGKCPTWHGEICGKCIVGK